MSTYGADRRTRSRGTKARHARVVRKVGPQGIRMLMILLVLAGIAAVALCRLISIQIFGHEAYLKRSRSMHIKRLTLPARRGQILDCHHRILAGSKEMFSICASSHGLTERHRGIALERLKQISWISDSKAEEAFGGKPKFVWLKRFCDDDMVQELRALCVPGVRDVVNYQRYYTSDWVSNVVGFININGRALEAAELRFNRYLSGVSGSHTINPYVKLDGEPFPQDTIKSPVDGASLVLTIDNTVQYILHEHLKQAVEEWNAKLALGVIMDPKTGAILGMVTYPSYSSSSFSTFDVSRYKARCITDIYEPGSFFKAFVMAAALDMNLVRPEDVLDCENGAFKVGKSTIRDWKAFGELTVTDVFVHSSNIGMSKLSMMLQPRLLHEYLMRFGLLDKPGLGLFAEPRTKIKSLSTWDDEYISFVSFGQGISLSALSTTSALCAIANDGILMKPYILAAIEDANGNVTQCTRPKVVRRVIQPKTAQAVSRMMRKVVTDSSGRRAAIKGVAVCGKTGTAQIFDSATMRYSHENLITSFIGFAPAEDPRIAVLISVFSPRHEQREIWGSTVAAPIFSAVTRHVLAYFGVRKPPFLNMARELDDELGVNADAG
ncbi:penicillin-binding protein 2 [bacterium]|nr:penicillin-binding protein 2 [bacterium]